MPDTVVPKITFTMHAGDDALWLVLRPGNGSQDGPITLATVKTVIFDGLNSRQIAQAFGYPMGGRHDERLADQGLHHRRGNGLAEVREGLADHPEVELVGTAADPGKAGTKLAESARQVILHGTDRHRPRAHVRDRGDPRRHRRADRAGHLGQRERASCPRRWRPASSTSCCCRS